MARPFISKVFLARHYSLQVPESTPVITVPIYLQSKLKKLKEKQELKQLQRVVKRRRAGNKDVTVIASRNSELNFYLGQTFPKDSIIPLASRGWRNSKSAGDFFTINSFSKNPSLPFIPEKQEKEEENSINYFSQFGLHERILDGLENLGIQHPTPIQSLSIPEIMKYHHVLLNSETGSGKTVAYLAPLFHHIITRKESRMLHRPPNSPFALILVPGRELAEQIKEVSMKISCCSGLSTRIILGGRNTSKFIRNPSEKERDPDVDVLVTTLGVLRKLVSSGIYDVSYVHHVVIDEVDTMLDDSFNGELTHFLKKFTFHQHCENYVDGTQMILAGATLPRNIPAILGDVIDTDNLIKIATSHLHRIMPHVSQKFLKLKCNEKAGKLLQLVKSDVKRKHPVMIFSNKSDSADWVSLFLEDNGIPNINFHGDVPSKLRIGRFHSFQKGELDVISCTDLGSRGLDTIRVQHVINFDCPVNMSDYIHRVGRIGRVGSHLTGHATTFVARPYEAELVQRIELAVRSVQALRGVNANIKKNLIMKSLSQSGLSEAEINELV